MPFNFSSPEYLSHHIASGVANSISEGDIFIYLCSAQLTSFEIDLISKEINCAEQEYMNMPPSLIELAMPMVHRTRKNRVSPVSRASLAHL